MRGCTLIELRHKCSHDISNALYPLLFFALSVALASAYAADITPKYSIQAILFGTSPDVPVAELVIGGPADVKIEIADIIWLIQGGGRTILFDSGFHRDTFGKRFPTIKYLRPDEAVKLAGVQPDESQTS